MDDLYRMKVTIVLQIGLFATKIGRDIVVLYDLYQVVKHV